MDGPEAPGHTPRATMGGARQVVLELVVNGALPCLVYAVAAQRFGASPTQGLMAATAVPALAVVIGLLRKRKVDTVAMVTLATLGLSIALAAATDDPKLLQLRESYFSAVIGAAMLGSALIGRPLMMTLAVRMAPPEKQSKLVQPQVRRLLTYLTWIWGVIFTAELAVKWWMVEHLSIEQVLAFGPVVFMGMSGVGFLATLATARLLKLKPAGS